MVGKAYTELAKTLNCIPRSKEFGKCQNGRNCRGQKNVNRKEISLKTM